MIISGLLKLTLLDFPGKTAATVFLGGCNMRCPFCHNSGIVLSPGDTQISEDDVFAYLEKRVGILDGVCVTGGEPLLSPDIDTFLERIKSLGYDVKLDTNGTFPEKLESLVSRSLVDYVAMDIKNCPERYAETVGIQGFDISPILRSVEFLKSGRVSHEFRTTAVSELHDVSAFEKIGQWLSGERAYFIQKFVDSGACLKDGLSPLSDELMQKCLKVVRQYVTNAQLRGM